MRTLRVEKAFAVRRIADNRRFFGYRLKVPYIRLFEGNEILHSGAFCVLAGNFKRSFVDVGTVGMKFYVMTHVFACGGALLPPHLGRALAPCLGGEAALYARGDVQRHERAFDYYSARTAHRVIQRVIVAQMSKRTERRGKRFFEGRRICRGTVSAFVKSPARSVNKERYIIFHYRKLYLIKTAGFVKPRNVIFCLEPFHYRLFYYCLTVAHAEKVGVKRISFYGECIRFSYPVFPRQRFCALKQVFKRVRLKRTEHHENALGKA